MLQPLRSVAQPGSALVWGTSGRGFESRRSDQISFKFNSLHFIFSQKYVNFVLRICKTNLMLL